MHQERVDNFPVIEIKHKKKLSDDNPLTEFIKYTRNINKGSPAKVITFIFLVILNLKISAKIAASNCSFRPDINKINSEIENRKKRIFLSFYFYHNYKIIKEKEKRDQSIAQFTIRVSNIISELGH